MNNEWTFWANGDSTLVNPNIKLDNEIHLVISDNITELNADTYLSLVDHSAMLHTLIEQNEEKNYVIDECDGKLKKGIIREQIKSEKEWYSMRNINLSLKYCITINSKYCCTEKRMSQVLISIRTLRIMKDGGSIDCGITPFNVSDADLLKKRFIAKAIKRKYIRVSAYLEKRIMIGSIHRLRWYNITLQEEGFHHINDVSGTSSISGDILEANILNNNKSDIIYIVVKNLNDGDIVEEEYDLEKKIEKGNMYLITTYKQARIEKICDISQIFYDILLGLTVKFLCNSLFKNNYFSDYYEFTEDVLKKVLSNFSISDSKEKSDKFLKLLCGEMIEFLFDKLSQIKYNYLTNDISYEDRWKKSKDIMYFKIQNREVLEYLRQFVDELNLNILILYSSYMLFKYLKNDSKIIFQRGKLQL
ncbi:hypothetical protein H8356DRAFT_1343767 [Neocallimastix lanati (nom. inval.)]|nr:hypothetical protein H8356DRAFT_1343767 [Neocallimastix sp. JGI-2020a]